MPPAPDSPASKAVKRRPWWKRALIVLGALVLLLIVFHRPIIFALVKFAAHKVGPSHGLAIDFQIHGTIFTGLTIQDLKITPTRPGQSSGATSGCSKRTTT